jgi:hypothetical protein
LPADWSRVEDWLGFERNVIFDKNPRETKKASKWPEIPILDDYGKSPNAFFWEKFPRRQLPEGPETKITLRRWTTG